MHRPLTQSDLLPRGPLRRLGRSLHWFAEIDSTNRFLLAAAADLPDGAVAWTEYQTAGRGRLGRAWQSPRGASVLLSVLLREPAGSPLGDYAALAGALAACEAITEAAGCPARLRWPNDIVAGERKLGGVLVESAAAGGRRVLVVGIGLNCLQHRGHFAAELREQATSLEIECAGAVDRAGVAATLLARLDEEFADAAPAGERVRRWCGAWASRSDDLGRRVRLVENGRTLEGTIVDLGEAGELVVQLDAGGRRAFSARTATRAW